MRNFESLPVRSAATLIALSANLGLIGVGCGGSKNERQPAETTTVRAGKVAVGFDVSAPQCGESLPKGAAFAIVGVNYPLPGKYNQCLDEEYKWAKGSKGGTIEPNAATYVLTADPGDVRPVVASWPKSGKNNYGTCHHTDSLACSFAYGEEKALEDLKKVSSLGDDKKIWLDFEPQVYSWTNDPAKNRADLEGMVTVFENARKKVGIYLQPSELAPTLGDLPSKSNLHGLPEWYLGQTTLSGAQNVSCTTPSVTGGRVELAQSAGGGIDKDIVCATR